MSVSIWGGAYDAVLRKSEFDETEHPRYPAGDSRGGQFAPKPVGYGMLKSDREQVDAFAAQFDSVPEGIGEGMERGDYTAMAKWSKAQLDRVLNESERKTLSDAVSFWVQEESVSDDPMYVEAAELWGDEFSGVSAEERDVAELHRVMLAQYAITQHVLRAVAPTGRVTLWRGIQNKDAAYGLGEQNYERSPLSSWTEDSDYASMFATALPSKTPRVLRADIPVEDVFMFPGTASLLNAELEYVVIGRDEPIPVKMFAPYSLPPSPYGLRD